MSLSLKRVSKCAVIVTVVVLSACHKPAGIAAAREATVEVQVAGGNAIILSPNRAKAVVGPVRRPTAGPVDDYNDHEMHMTLTYGSVVKSDLPALIDKPNWWLMTGYDIEFCDDGNCAQTETLQVPADVTNLTCDSAKTDTLSYAPNLATLHPDAKLRSDWPTLLGNRVTFRRGRLYTNSVGGCYEFLKDGKVIESHALPNGKTGIRNEFKTTARFVDVVFRSGTERKTLRLAPKDGMLKLEIRSGHPVEPTLKAGDFVKRFSPYYDLLAAPVASKVSIRAQVPEGQVNPGEECPSFVATAPN